MFRRSASMSVPGSPTRSARRSIRRSSAVLLVAGLAFTACSSSDETVTPGSVASGSADASSDSEADVSPVALQENGPIAVEGAVLAPFDDESVGSADPAVGVAAPVITGESFDGTEIVVGGPTENPTMVVFLAHWCPHCNDEVPMLLDLEASGELPEGLDVIGVSTAVASDRDNFPPSQWTVDTGWDWPMMADDEALTAINSMGGQGFPFAVVLDTDGTVLARKAGESAGPATVEFLDAALSNAAS